MADYTITLTDTETKALLTHCVDIDDWLTNFAQVTASKVVKRITMQLKFHLCSLDTSLIAFELQLNELDLQYIISDSGNYNPDFKINSVLDQLPKANSKVKQGRKIYLTLNASDFEMVEIPKITRTTVRQARKTIESLGFIFGGL